jgi:DNA-binding CsgD family transcriptional regulator
VTSTDSVASDQQRPRGLTRRESEVVLLVGAGMSNGEIARQLGMTVGTVKIHMHSIFQKTGATRRYELIAEMAHAKQRRVS